MMFVTLKSDTCVRSRLSVNVTSRYTSPVARTNVRVTKLILYSLVAFCAKLLTHRMLRMSKHTLKRERIRIAISSQNSIKNVTSREPTHGRQERAFQFTSGSWRQCD